MKANEAIKYLKQLYPNGGHCWLDEQRIEAIGMAIAALQEEPESIWRDASEKPIKGKIILVVQDNGFPFVCDVRNDIGYVSLSFDHNNKTKIDGKDKWAYIEDLLKLSNIHKTIKNWKEPVSKDLEELINTLNKRYPEVSFAKLSRIAVRVAKWQEKQDQSTIELAEDHAMLAGMNKMEEQMMAKAIDCEVHQTNVAGIKLDSVEICSDGIMLDNTLYKEGDKVKVIVIKED